jgi:hypothetical protein
MTTNYETKTLNNMNAFSNFQEAVNVYDDYLKSIGIAKQQRVDMIKEAARTAVFMYSLNE